MPVPRWLRPAAVLPLAIVLASCSSGSSSGSAGTGGTTAPTTTTLPPGPGTTASDFVSDWSHLDWTAMLLLVHRPPADFVATNKAVLSDLGASTDTVSAGSVVTSGTSATAPVSEQLAITGLGNVTLKGLLALRLFGTRWLVVWSQSAIDTALGPTGHLSLEPIFAPRAAILDATGQPLVTTSPTVTIGVLGSYIKNPTTLVSDLVAAGATETEASSAVAAARQQTDVFVPVFTVSEARYEQLKPTIYPVPGTVFRANAVTAVSPGLSALLGTVGTPSAQMLTQLGPLYNSDSIVGLSGIEASEQSQLAGKPGAEIVIADAAGEPVSDVAHFAPIPGTPVRTSIDPTIEAAAESAMSGQTLDAALVAVRASTGQVVAAVNSPALGNFDLALDGGQPPGSTFKVITSTALIMKGLTPQSPATCPPVINVDGENLHNAEGDAAVSNMLQAFAESCNTAFIGLTMAHLGDADLHNAAALYGIGQTPSLGAPAFGGSVPVATGQTDLAASAIGQAQVLLSPLDEAMAAAAVDTGVVRAPRLVMGAPDDTAATHTLPSDVVQDLHTMMAAVVAYGTASGTGLPSGTYAKTGTAEYGSGNPLPIVAWLMGFNGDIAFAMCVVDAPANGGPNDGPIIANFLDALGD